MRSSFATTRGWGFGGTGGGGAPAESGGGHGAGLNLTPMVDMFTILIVFLIKGYSVNPAFLTPTQDIKLAETSSEISAPDKAVLIIGKDGIIVEGKVVVAFKSDSIDKAKLAPKEVEDLRISLESLANRTKFISEKNESVQFTGTLILQADKDLPFELMKPILRTAGLVGFNDIKFAALYPD